MYFNMAALKQNMGFYFYCIVWGIFFAVIKDISATGIVEEYCRGEPFQAQCDTDEVIVMTSAVHGRMKLGRCVKHDYGKLGCQRDVLLQMDSYCSGRRVCNKDMITGSLKFPECLGELASYMEAAYTCEKLMVVERGGCRLTDNQKGFLPNVFTEANKCGSPTKPWVMEVDSSQKINITLIDMGVYIAQQRKKTDCVQYGTVREMNFGREHTICGGKDRITHLMITQGNKIEITLMSPHDIHDAHFLLKFEVLGCEDFSLPSDMWLKRGSGHVIVGCYSSRDTWRLDCVDDQWQGAIGNCTRAVPPTPLIRHEVTPKPEVEIDMEVFSNEIGIAAAVVTSVFLSILLLVIGLLYDRRRTSQMERDIIQVHVSEEFSWSAANKKQIPQQNGQTNTLCKEDVTPGGKTQNYQRVSEWCEGQRPPSHVDHIYDTPSYFDLDPDYMRQSNNDTTNTLVNRDSYLQPGDDKQLGHLNTLGNRDSYLQPMDNTSGQL